MLTLPKHLVLDTGWKRVRTHWIERFWFGPPMDEDDRCMLSGLDPSRFGGTFNAVLDRIPEMAGGEHMLWWGAIMIVRGQEHVMIFARQNFVDADNQSRAVVFTNSDNLWTYLLLKYR